MIKIDHLFFRFIVLRKLVDLEILEIASFSRLVLPVSDQARKVEIDHHVIVLIGVNLEERCQDSELGRQKYGSRNRTTNVAAQNSDLNSPI